MFNRLFRAVSAVADDMKQVRPAYMSQSVMDTNCKETVHFNNTVLLYQGC